MPHQLPEISSLVAAISLEAELLRNRHLLHLFLLRTHQIPVALSVGQQLGRATWPQPCIAEPRTMAEPQQVAACCSRWIRPAARAGWMGLGSAAAAQVQDSPPAPSADRKVRTLEDLMPTGVPFLCRIGLTLSTLNERLVRLVLGRPGELAPVAHEAVQKKHCRLIVLRQRFARPSDSAVHPRNKAAMLTHQMPTISKP